MMPSPVRGGALLLPADCSEEEELLRLRVAWLDMLVVNRLEECCCVCVLTIWCGRVFSVDFGYTGLIMSDCLDELMY